MIFQCVFFISSLFFIFSIFWDCRICCDHLNVWGFFVFQYCLFFFYFNFPLFFQVFFFCFVAIFMSKKIICFIFIFRGGSPQQWIRAKGSSKSFLTKAPTPPWHHWEQSTLFSIFLAFFIYLCIYMFIHILKLHFYHFIEVYYFFGFFYIFFLSLFQLKLKKQSMKAECIVSTLTETASGWHSLS